MSEERWIDVETRLCFVEDELQTLRTALMEQGLVQARLEAALDRALEALRRIAAKSPGDEEKTGDAR